MGKLFSPKNVINYAVLAVVFFLGYKYLFDGKNTKTSDPFRDSAIQHPKNVLLPDHDEGENVITNGDPKGAEDEDTGADVKMDVGDMPKDLEPKDTNDDLTHQKLKKDLKEQFDKQAGADKSESQGGPLGKKQDTKKFHPDGVDWDLEDEMKKRRTSFFKFVQEREEPMGDTESQDMHERDDLFTFVTAGSHSTYPATIQFIYSIQYFYPESKIAIYDIGLTKDERQLINSLCNAEVKPMWLMMWPENMYKIRHRIWRPLVLQFSLTAYGHFVYVEPGRYVFRQGIKDYIEQSRIHGVTIGGRQQKYSTYVVTNPHMYGFFVIDDKKLKKTPHFDFTMMVIHNTKRVRNKMMRYLMACVLEEYCIAPPGSKPQCDMNLNMANKRYANCHRYDESALNIILNIWHDYTPRQYLMKDLITKYYDGKDMSKRVRVCNKNNKDEV